MWAIARADLGMTRAEFLKCSPKEFDALCRRLYQRDRKARYNAAMLCAAVWEVHRDRDKRPEPYTAEFFLGEDDGRQSDEQQVMTLENIFGCGPSNPTGARRNQVIERKKHA